MQIILLRHPTELANQVPVVIRRDTVVILVTAFLAEMDDALPFFLVDLHPDGHHQSPAVVGSVAGHIQIDMLRVKAVRAMIPAAAAFVLFYLSPAMEADEAFVVGDHVFSNVHLLALSGKF